MYAAISFITEGPHIYIRTTLQKAIRNSELGKNGDYYITNPYKC
jgi:hypothetical protein